MIIKTLNQLLTTVYKATSTLEDATDVAKGKTTTWKVEAMKEVQEKLEDTNMAEVKKFYQDLYD